MHILLLDDDDASRRLLDEWLDREGYSVDTATDLATAREAIAARRPDLALLDLELPDGMGTELVEELHEPPAADVVVVTGHATVDTAVGALRDGVVDYLTKPIDLDHLRQLLRTLARAHALREEVAALRDQLRQLGRFGRMVGSSPAMQEAYDLLSKVAPTPSSVLLRGETGTGKELAARTLHELSGRKDGPFEALNCGAIPSELIESELFGHEKGSFTGAERQHHGIFERADGGTLFLDEITEMPAELQVRLLRVLESRRVRRVGGKAEIEVDVRVVSATNRDPREAIAEGQLREDLFFRLAVFPVELPPLRERGQDIALLAQSFVEEANRDAETPCQLHPDALARLAAHDWPGNVRELRNAIERACILASGEIRPEHLPLGSAPVPASGGAGDLGIVPGMSIAEAEKRLIEATLEQLDGDKKGAAARLGISLKTLYNRLNRYEAEAAGRRAAGGDKKAGGA